MNVPRHQRTGARRRSQLAHEARQGRHRISRRRDAARRRDEVAGGSRRARLRFGARRSAERSGTRALCAHRRSRRHRRPHRRHQRRVRQLPRCRLAGAGLRPAVPRCANARHPAARARPGFDATAFRSSHDGLPEPLCAIYEPQSRVAIAAQIAAGRNCPRKFLINAHTQLLDQPNPRALDNVNTVDEYERAMSELNHA